MPADSLCSIRDSIDFAKKLGPDYVSFNMFSPRKFTLLSEEKPPADNSILRKYIKKGYLQFYMMPGYLIRRLLNIHSFYELAGLLFMGIRLLVNMVGIKENRV